MSRTSRKGIAGLALIFFLCPGIVHAGQQGDPPPIKAVIRYSVAPWDGSAYEILIPMMSIPESSHASIRIDIWGNPEFQKAKTLRFSRQGTSKEAGRSSFQSGHDSSLPVSLTGTVTFRAIRNGKPVFGTFEFTAPDGRIFKASFQAGWGNKPPPYIR